MYKCKYCGKEFEKGSIGGHTTFCVCNPNREHNIKKNSDKNHMMNMVKKRIENRENNPDIHTRKEVLLKCEKCGKEFTQIVSDYNIQKGKYKRFCSPSCANSRVSRKGKTKISKCIGCGKNIEIRLNTANKYIICNACKQGESNKIHESDIEKLYANKQKICIICGKKFLPNLTDSGRFSKNKCCSEECTKIHRINNGHKAYESAKLKGIHKPWQSRNIISYPEKFWTGVLDNNGIKYIKELFFDKKYFLDFYIEKNNYKVDLEIDGGQHNNEDHIEHDRIRDDYLKSHNIIVYRISWNNINTNSGKEEMKFKIDKFIEFYNSL